MQNACKIVLKVKNVRRSKQNSAVQANVYKKLTLPCIHCDFQCKPQPNSDWLTVSEDDRQGRISSATDNAIARYAVTGNEWSSQSPTLIQHAGHSELPHSRNVERSGTNYKFRPYDTSVRRQFHGEELNCPGIAAIPSFIVLRTCAVQLHCACNTKLHLIILVYSDNDPWTFEFPTAS